MLERNITNSEGVTPTNYLQIHNDAIIVICKCLKENKEFMMSKQNFRAKQQTIYEIFNSPSNWIKYRPEVLQRKDIARKTLF